LSAARYRWEVTSMPLVRQMWLPFAIFGGTDVIRTAEVDVRIANRAHVHLAASTLHRRARSGKNKMGESCQSVVFVFHC